MKKILFLLFITLIFGGCQEKVATKTPSDVFTENSNMGLYIDGRRTFIFDQNTHQLCIGDNEFRIQTDTQDQFVNFKLGITPTELGKSTSVIITARGIKGISNGPCIMTLKKTEDQNIWLWNESKKLGIVMSLAQ